MSDRYQVNRLAQESHLCGWYFEKDGESFVDGPDGSTVIFKCLNCHEYLNILAYSVNAYGEVDPAVGCTGKALVTTEEPKGWARVACDFRENIILDDWPTNRTKAAGELVRETP